VPGARSAERRFRAAKSEHADLRTEASLNVARRDDGYLDKLRALGLGPDDEVKLVAMRDYLWKLARQSK